MLLRDKEIYKKAIERWKDALIKYNNAYGAVDGLEDLMLAAHNIVKLIKNHMAVSIVRHVPITTYSALNAAKAVLERIEHDTAKPSCIDEAHALETFSRAAFDFLKLYDELDFSIIPALKEKYNVIS